MAKIRVATLNVCSGKPRENWHEALKKIVSLDIDILLVQEAENGTLRSRRANHVGDIARAMGRADHAFLPGKNTIATILGFAKEPTIGDRGQGIGIISKLPVVKWAYRHLQSTETLVRIKGTSLQADQPRQVLAAVIETDDGPLSIGCTHLSFRPDSSKAQLAEAVDFVSGMPGRHILGGDFNQWKNRSTWDTLVEGVTFPAANPDKQIDYLVGNVRSTGGGAEQMPISDHRLLWTDISTP